MKDVCDGDDLDLTCPSPSKISIIDANYGRLSSDVCSEGRPPSQLEITNCTYSGRLDKIKTNCDGKEQCSLEWQALYPGVDPCVGIWKYATVTYECIYGKLS